MNVKVFCSLAVALVLTACATRPESISASYVSHEKYAGLTCEQLNTQMVDARANLQKFSEMQNSKANMDAATVFFVLIPASKLSGDSAGDVAKWKGEVEAIDTAQIRGGCKGLARASIPVQTPSQAEATSTGQDFASVKVIALQALCSSQPNISRTGTGPGYDTYGVTCTNGSVLNVRCETGNCRISR